MADGGFGEVVGGGELACGVSVPVAVDEELAVNVVEHTEAGGEEERRRGWVTGRVVEQGVWSEGVVESFPCCGAS